jgi:hypothetical protein
MITSPDLANVRSKLQEMEQHISRIWSLPRRSAETIPHKETPAHRETLLERIARFFSYRG